MSCAYRKEHEFDADGLCVHCFRSIEEPTVVVPKLEVHPLARLECVVCGGAGTFTPIGPNRWAVRCEDHA
jgi:hypothetical protein